MPDPGQDLIEVLERIAGWDEMSNSRKGLAGIRPRLGFEVHGIGELLRTRAPFPDIVYRESGDAMYEALATFLKERFWLA